MSGESDDDEEARIRSAIARALAEGGFEDVLVISSW